MNNEEFSDNSDSDDQDFVPGREEAPDSDVSEGGDEKTDKADKSTKNGTTAKGKRKPVKNGKGVTKLKRTKRARNGKVEDNEEDSDDSDDEDFVAPEIKSQITVSEGPNLNHQAEVEAEEKARTDRLWADFLTSVETSKNKRKSEPIEEVKIVTKVYDFAGERVEVQEKVKVKLGTDDENSSSTKNCNDSKPNGIKLVNKTEVRSQKETNGTSSLSPSNGVAGSSKEATPGDPASQTAKSHIPRRGGISFLSGSPDQIGLGVGNKKIGGGLSSVLNALHAKKQKMGTLEKSKLDWNSFKQKEGIEEEMHTHTKSKNGYLEKQEFLHRADLRQFELEKSLRTKSRRNNK